MTFPRTAVQEIERERGRESLLAYENGLFSLSGLDRCTHAGLACRVVAITSKPHGKGGLYVLPKVLQASTHVGSAAAASRGTQRQASRGTSQHAVSFS